MLNNTSYDICQDIFANLKSLELDEPLFFQDSNEQEAQEMVACSEEQEPQGELSELDFFYNYEEIEQCQLDALLQTPSSPLGSRAISETANQESTESSWSHSKVGEKAASDDMNLLVDEILEFCYGSGPQSKSKKSTRDLIRKRSRKSKDQMKVLETEYMREQNWTKAHMKSLSKKIGLSFGQIYKWNWDQRKKTMTEEERQCEMFFVNRSQ